MKRPCIAACLIIAACGSSPNAVDGSVRGQSLHANAAAMIRLPTQYGPVLSVFLSDRSDICAALQGNGRIKSTTTLILSVARVSGQQFVTATEGSYSITGTEDWLAGAKFTQFDGNCRGTIGASPVATDGQVKLTQVQVIAGGSAEGTFDLTLGSEKLTGRFDATDCPIDFNAPVGGCY
jgi:hypothetical protein